MLSSFVILSDSSTLAPESFLLRMGTCVAKPNDPLETCWTVVDSDHRGYVGYNMHHEGQIFHSKGTALIHTCTILYWFPFKRIIIFFINCGFNIPVHLHLFAKNSTTSPIFLSPDLRRHICHTECHATKTPSLLSNLHCDGSCCGQWHFGRSEQLSSDLESSYLGRLPVVPYS